MEKEIKQINQQLQKHKMLLRSLYMIFFIVVYSVSKFLIIGLALFQLITIIMTEKPNEPILRLAQSLSIYIYQIIQFMTFNSEIKPFPFSTWPSSKDESNHDPVNNDGSKPD